MVEKEVKRRSAEIGEKAAMLRVGEKRTSDTKRMTELVEALKERCEEMRNDGEMLFWIGDLLFGVVDGAAKAVFDRILGAAFECRADDTLVRSIRALLNRGVEKARGDQDFIRKAEPFFDPQNTDKDIAGKIGTSLEAYVIHCWREAFGEVAEKHFANEGKEKVAEIAADYVADSSEIVGVACEATKAFGHELLRTFCSQSDDFLPKDLMETMSKSNRENLLMTSGLWYFSGDISGALKKRKELHDNGPEDEFDTIAYCEDEDAVRRELSTIETASEIAMLRERIIDALGAWGGRIAPNQAEIERFVDSHRSARDRAPLANINGLVCLLEMLINEDAAKGDDLLEVFPHLVALSVDPSISDGGSENGSSVMFSVLACISSVAESIEDTSTLVDKFFDVVRPEQSERGFALLAGMPVTSEKTRKLKCACCERYLGKTPEEVVETLDTFGDINSARCATMLMIYNTDLMNGRPERGERLLKFGRRHKKDFSEASLLYTLVSFHKCISIKAGIDYDAEGGGSEQGVIVRVDAKTRRIDDMLREIASQPAKEPPLEAKEEPPKRRNAPRQRKMDSFFKPI